MRMNALSNLGFSPRPDPRAGRRGRRNSSPPSTVLRQLEDQRMATEARERRGVSNESHWDKLKRLLCGPATIMTSVREDHSYLTVAMQLSAAFGSDYKPRDGIKLVLRSPETHFPLKINWSMVFVSSPSGVCPDPRSTFFMQAELPTSLFEAIGGFTHDQLKVLVQFRDDKRNVTELDVRSFGPAPTLY